MIKLTILLLYKSSIFISRRTSLSYEHIGRVFYLLRSPLFSEKIVVLKKTNCEVISLSTFFMLKTDVFSIHYLKTQMEKPYFLINERYRMDKHRFLHNSILLEFSSFSQVEWRYIRYHLENLQFVSTVVHSRFFSLDFRNLNSFFNLNNIKHGNLLLLHSMYINISYFSFFFSVIYLSIFFSRSRLTDNSYIDDSLMVVAPIDDTLPESDFLISHDVDDIEIKQIFNLNVEQQISISGFFVDNNLFSLYNFDSLFSFCYLDLYISMVNIYSLFLFFFLSNLLYIFFFFSSYLFTIRFLLFRNLFISIFFFINSYYSS